MKRILFILLTGTVLLTHPANAMESKAKGTFVFICKSDAKNTGLHLEHALFLDCLYEHTAFINCTFVGCTFKRVKISDTTFQKTTFIGCFVEKALGLKLVEFAENPDTLHMEQVGIDKETNEPIMFLTMKTK